MRVGDRVRCITTRVRGCCGTCADPQPALHNRGYGELGYVQYISFKDIVTVEWDTEGPGQIENLWVHELEVIPDDNA